MLASASYGAARSARALVAHSRLRKTHGCIFPGFVGSRFASGAAASPDGPIGIVMLNMGGPSSLHGEHDGVGLFLHRLFSDGEIIRLGPLQKFLVRDQGT